MAEQDDKRSSRELPIDDQPLREGKLDADEKLDIAIAGSMMTSEPPQISEPRTAGDDAEERGEGDDG
jgi:hypothetical protein